MDGGKGFDLPSSQHPAAGGAGGVIQIIAPQGEIAAETLSLKRGENSNNFCKEKAEDGYFLLEGNLRYT